MKCVIVLLICTVLLGCNSENSKDDKKGLYTDEFDDFDVEEVLRNKRLFNHYLMCFRTGKNCTPLAQRVRELIPELIRSECARCTPTQWKKGRQVLDFILQHHPEIFLEFEKKYDPERIYRKTHADRIKKEGIVLPKYN